MEETVDHGLDEVIPHASPCFLKHILLQEEFDKMRKKHDAKHPRPGRTDPSIGKKHRQSRHEIKNPNAVS